MVVSLFGSLRVSLKHPYKA